MIFYRVFTQPGTGQSSAPGTKKNFPYRSGCNQDCRCRTGYFAYSTSYTNYGVAAMPGWLLDEKRIALHVPVWDKSGHYEGTFSHTDFVFDAAQKLFNTIDPKRSLTETPCLRQTSASNTAKNDGSTSSDCLVTQLANRIYATLYFCKAGQRFPRLCRHFFELARFCRGRSDWNAHKWPTLHAP
jgi:hypothetical protein